tara:strand:- start:27 stop:230 length:204 start_codon:yes stop_codon:yes gene_type:complete
MSKAVLTPDIIPVCELLKAPTSTTLLYVEELDSNNDAELYFSIEDRVEFVVIEKELGSSVFEDDSPT